MKTICDRCIKYSISVCGTSETCHAFIDRQTRFSNGITKDYINQRITGEKNHCKEYKSILINLKN
tara:strand:+ start:48 stop:242 length:195 start_codon:yes stop_codon:yes gene_type:complete